MENKIFCKTISVDRVKYGFDLKMVLHFYFHYKLFSGQTCKERDRERERRESYWSTQTAPPRLIAPHRRLIHLDRSHPDRSTKDRITQIDRIPSRSHHHRRPIHPKPISLMPSLPMTDLVALLSLLMTHDQSLHFPPFLISLSSSLSQFDRMVEFNEWCCFDFFFFLSL